MEGMEAYPRAAVERAMKVQEVMLRAIARKITWYQAAEILGITDRHLRRWRERYEQFGFDGVLDMKSGHFHLLRTYPDEWPLRDHLRVGFTGSSPICAREIQHSPSKSLNYCEAVESCRCSRANK